MPDPKIPAPAPGMHQLSSDLACATMTPRWADRSRADGHGGVRDPSGHVWSIATPSAPVAGGERQGAAVASR